MNCTYSAVMEIYYNKSYEIQSEGYTGFFAPYDYNTTFTLTWGRFVSPYLFDMISRQPGLIVSPTLSTIQSTLSYSGKQYYLVTTHPLHIQMHVFMMKSIQFLEGFYPL